MNESPFEEEDAEWESLPASSAALLTPSSRRTAVVVDDTNDDNKEEDPLVQAFSSLIQRRPQSSQSVAPQILNNQSASSSFLSASNNNNNNNNSNHGWRHDRLQQLSRQLETRTRLKDKLFHHPLHLFWSRFFAHFARELWEIDVRIRLAIVLIVLGAVIRTLVLSTIVFWYSRTLLAGMVLAASWIYINPKALENTMSFIHQAFSSPDAFARYLGTLKEERFRQMALALLLVLTLLEVRTFQFLTDIVCDQSELIKVIVYSFIIMGVMRYSQQTLHVRSREATHKGMIVLYGLALLVTFSTLDVWRMPRVAGPFCFSLGVVLLAVYGDDDMEWLARVVRQALRFTLRDVLEQVGNDVHEDELLQLAMLRWIVDYWSSSSSSSSSPSRSSPSHQTPSASSDRTSQSSHATSTVGISASIVSRPSPPHTLSSTSIIDTSSTVAAANQELQWNDLLSMLSLTTQQMASEAQTLQQEGHPATESAGTIPVPSQTAPTPQPATSPPPLSQASSNSSPHEDAFADLQSMLASMDLDERAKPAVMAYKRAVQGFPPERRVAVLISICRRCPAVILIFLYILMAQRLAAIIILIPFSFFELMRVKEWSQACKKMSGLDRTADTSRAEFLERVDPMVILLCGESAYPLPTLLKVWVNICSSVSALEMGLTAARCAQTTAVAANFANDLISLASFGAEVSERGWMHGAAVVLSELLLFHTSSGSKEAKIATAAVRIVESSRKLSHNLQVLSGEESHMINALLDVAATILGKGWLWGTLEQPPLPPSTVVIEELGDDSGSPSNLLAPGAVDAITDASSRQDASLVALRNSEDSGNGTCLQKSAEASSAESSQPKDSTKDTPLTASLNREESSKVKSLCAFSPVENDLDTNVAATENLANLDQSASESRALQCANISVNEIESHTNVHCAPSEVEQTPSDDFARETSKVAKPNSSTAFEDDDDFEPIDSSNQREGARPFKSSISGRDLNEADEIKCIMNHAEASESAEAQGTSQQHEYHDNMWLQVGSGLALLGAVAGTVAFAMKGDDDKQKKRRPTE